MTEGEYLIKLAEAAIYQLEHYLEELKDGYLRGSHFSVDVDSTENGSYNNLKLDLTIFHDWGDGE